MNTANLASALSPPLAALIGKISLWLSAWPVSDSSAMAYVGVEDPDGKIVWGAGEHHDIITASIKGLISALNRM